MKAIVCELCGSQDLIKQDGVYICQNCGAKYSAEEAKKLMVEVAGDLAVKDADVKKVKIDTSDELGNLYQIARRAKDDNNSENAAKYYDMILVKDPLSWEAAFYVVYFKAADCKIAQIHSAAVSVSNCIESVLKLIKDNVEDVDKQVEAVNEVATRCMLISTMLYNGAENHYNSIGYQIQANYTQELINNCCAARDIVYILGNKVDSIFDGYEQLHNVSVAAWKDGITKHHKLLRRLAQKEINKNIILEYAAKIQKYDSSYEAPSMDTTTPVKSGCYVATAVYGSYDCPQVWTLRRFRDFTLADSWLGRLFIYLYYAISPTLVKWFGETRWFKNMWKPVLDRMVDRLNARGVEDTPYNDRNW